MPTRGITTIWPSCTAGARQSASGSRRLRSWRTLNRCGETGVGSVRYWLRTRRRIEESRSCRSDAGADAMPSSVTGQPALHGNGLSYLWHWGSARPWTEIRSFRGCDQEPQVLRTHCGSPPICPLMKRNSVPPIGRKPAKPLTLVCEALRIYAKSLYGSRVSFKRTSNGAPLRGRDHMLIPPSEGDGMLRGRVRIILALIAGILLFSTAVPGQLNRGVIEGTLTDPQGAVMPGVDVIITNVETNVAVPLKTNSAGYYRAVDLVPGQYRADFTA